MANTGIIELQVLHVAVQDNHYFLPLIWVEKALQLVALTVSPGVPSCVAGLMNLHGSSFPVIDLALRLGFCIDQEHELDAAIVVCHHDNFRAGIIVDEILGVETLYQDDRQMSEHFKVEDGTPYDSVFSTSLGLIILLNMPRVFDLGCSDWQSVSSVVDGVPQEIGPSTEGQ